jgi:hypothetical protein
MDELRELWQAFKVEVLLAGTFVLVLGVRVGLDSFVTWVEVAHPRLTHFAETLENGDEALAVSLASALALTVVTRHTIAAVASIIKTFERHF